jgi:hypothetical protein
MGPYMAEAFLRTGTRRISSWPGEATLHKKAGYIDADFLPPNFSLAVRRRTIHFGNLPAVDRIPEQFTQNRTLQETGDGLSQKL